MLTSMWMRTHRLTHRCRRTHTHTHTLLPYLPLMLGQEGRNASRCTHRVHIVSTAQNSPTQVHWSGPVSGSPAASGCPQDLPSLPVPAHGVNLLFPLLPISAFCLLSICYLEIPGLEHQPANRDFSVRTSCISSSSFQEAHRWHLS